MASERPLHGPGDRAFDILAREVRGCRRCAAQLPLAPRPVFQAHPDARILVVGQAPGRRAHDTGIPFNDPSGVRLRDWLGLDQAQFYDAQQVALLPMGFCYPGTGAGGDLPPRPECAAQWRAALLDSMPRIRLTVLLGRHAIDWHLGQSRATLAERVRRWRDHAPARFIAPHPSPRNRLWLRRNPWFEAELLPALRAQVKCALADAARG